MDFDKTLKAASGRVVIKIDIENKNTHAFADGTVIRLERQWNNLNRRETEPVNCIVIDGENITQGTEILIHPNAINESNRIYNYKGLTEELSGHIKYYSIPEEQCFAWLNGSEWLPLRGFAFALRVYNPYNGSLIGVDATLIKDVLYITTGELKGSVVHTLKASDYEIIFQGTDGREGRLIRCRHFEDEEHEREEVVAISHYLTEQVESGELIVGISTSDAKQIKQLL
tara:strand:- start:3358 stop:4041 length:684 start_codon:yes stop_codon:yes gene_type:complete